MSEKNSINNEDTVPDTLVNIKNTSQNGSKENEDALLKQNNELLDKFLRIAAEFDNYKKRSAIEVENSKDMGKFEMMKSLLTILDEFEITVMAASKSNDKNMAKGVEMLYLNFKDTLKKLGLSEINTKGIYDPYTHEIVIMQDDDSKEGTILDVIKKGYMFNNKLLRVASVIVSSGKNGTHSKQLTNEEKENNENNAKK
ncbi:MAG: nucleotide exchange factor GrpE [Candidatus Marsarchaeota archaeon]|nr:nucleotide exchange factor GrpE [Candidatus Marsarchaeota archaeon]